jgi:hypothetical protein
MDSYVTKVASDAYERQIAKHWEGEIMARKRDPRSHPPKQPTKVKKLPSEKINRRLQGRLAAGHENPVRVSSGGQDEFPIVCPVVIDVHRVDGLWEHETAGNAVGLMGHIIDLDFYTKESRVMIKMYRDPNALSIEVNGEEVYRWIEDGDTIPIKHFDILAQQSERANRWIEQVDLKPGDEVIEGDDGQPVIIRVDGIVETLPDEDVFGVHGDDAIEHAQIAEDDDPIIDPEDDDDELILDDEDDVEWE